LLARLKREQARSLLRNGLRHQNERPSPEAPANAVSFVKNISISAIF